MRRIIGITMGVVIVALIVVIVYLYQIGVNANDPCQSLNTDLQGRINAWNQRWNTASSDPGGQIRAEGKQLTSQIATTLDQCQNSISDHDKLFLTQGATVINAEIDKNVNYGPPCNPNCQTGPPVS